MKKYITFFGACFLAEFNLWSMYPRIIDWGKWYKDKLLQKIGIIEESKEQMIKEGAFCRNLLLSSKNKCIYINNMYPIREEYSKYTQLSFCYKEDDEQR